MIRDIKSLRNQNATPRTGSPRGHIYPPGHSQDLHGCQSPWRQFRTSWVVLRDICCLKRLSQYWRQEAAYTKLERRASEWIHKPCTPASVGEALWVQLGRWHSAEHATCQRGDGYKHSAVGLQGSPGVCGVQINGRNDCVKRRFFEDCELGLKGWWKFNREGAICRFAFWLEGIREKAVV